MNAATRRIARQNTLQDENRVQHKRVTRSKLTTTTEITTTTTTSTGLTSKVGIQNATAGTRKRAALGDVTNAHKKTALGDITNAVVKNPVEKPVAKRPVARKQSSVNEKKVAATTSAKPVTSKPITTNSSVLVPKKRPSEAVAPTAVVPQPRRTLKQSISTSSMTQKNSSARVPFRRRAEEAAEQEAPRKKQKMEPKQDWDDLDAEEANDPLMVSEYVVDIFDYLRQIEIKTMPNPSYMKSQLHLEWRMRGILVDWLIEVHAKFRLLPETLFLCVNLVDRFLSVRTISMEKLQLVGITALLVACKYEEIMAPAIEAFLYVADGGYTEEEILKAERYLLHIVNFDLSYPNPMNFLRRISKADDYDIYSRTIAKYLIEISVVDDRFLKHPPSIVAAAGMFLSRAMMDRGPWTPNLVHYSGYSEKKIRPVVCLMLDYLSRKEILHEAFFKKYAAKKFMKASIMVREWIRSQYGLETIANMMDDGKLEAVDEDQEIEKENVSDDERNAENEEDKEGSELDDYLYANELEEHEVESEEES